MEISNANIATLVKGFQGLYETHPVEIRLPYGGIRNQFIDESDFADYIISAAEKGIKEKAFSTLAAFRNYVSDSVKTVLPSNAVMNERGEYVVNTKYDVDIAAIRGLPSVADGSIDVKFIFDSDDDFIMNPTIEMPPRRVKEMRVSINPEKFITDYQKRMFDLANICILLGYNT